MKAQKLAYLAESLYGHLESRDLSAGAFQAWEHGPAQPELYRAIKSRVGDNPAAPLPPFSGVMPFRRILRKSTRGYGTISAE
ncbi:type II toxin-antitoxin system antitoxin SocA domain-containing protein [Pseudoglutamicibacter albus]|uniref:type II toxin-antitoxin system antitoxin SocA domain-containing protein n=1 Tax=Pseudoglutamicibacter albus TaxID=98671 RepID=UPI00360AFC7D